ncbi:MAG: cysteine desulfurase family protein [Bacteroidota bacterium]
MKVYLDNAATTPLSDEVLQVMIPFMKENFGNPSAIHSFGRTTRAAIETARKQVAKALNCSPAEIFFTSSGTEANNMAIKCSVRDLGIKHVITSPIEHHCVSHTTDYLEENHLATIHLLRVNDKGQMDLQHLEELLSQINEPTLVSLMHANNEIGTMVDIEKLAEICSKHGALLHCDTVQTIGHYPFDLQKTKINFLSGSGHKFHGPKGAGFIYINADTKIKSFIHGGAQERNMRAGTENMYGIIGLGKAIEDAYAHFDEHKNHILSLKKYMITRLQESIEDIKFNGDISDNSLYTVLSVSFPPSDKNETLLFNLDINGIAASAGSACSSGADTGSHVLNAIKADPARKGIRFSFSRYTTKEEIDFVIEKLKTIVGSKETVAS